MSEETPKTIQADKTLTHVLLHQTGVLSTGETALTTDATMLTACETMRSAGQDSLPVTQDELFVGVVENSHGDDEASRYGHDPSHTTIAESMSRKVICCFEDEDCRTALDRMIENGLTLLPVVARDMRIVGLVTRADLLGEREVGEKNVK